MTANSLQAVKRPASCRSLSARVRTDRRRTVIPAERLSRPYCRPIGHRNGLAQCRLRNLGNAKLPENLGHTFAQQERMAPTTPGPNVHRNEVPRTDRTRCNEPGRSCRRVAVIRKHPTCRAGPGSPALGVAHGGTLAAAGSFLPAAPRLALPRIGHSSLGGRAAPHDRSEAAQDRPGRQNRSLSSSHHLFDS
jgi:hypothetical protein